MPTGPNALRIAEGMMAIMIAGGVPPQVAAFAVDRLALYIAADSYDGSLFVNRWMESGIDRDEFINGNKDQIRSFFSNLPSDRFPLLSKHADALTAGTNDVRLEFGLDMLIRSLETYVEKPETS